MTKTKTASERIRELRAKKMEKKVKQTEITKIGGFRFYLEEVLDPGSDPFHTAPKEYYVEHIESKKRVAFHIALKFGDIEGIDIDADMYDFIHDYDEGLD